MDISVCVAIGSLTIGTYLIRFESLRRRTAFRFNKLSARKHIVDGLIAAQSHIDKVVYHFRQTYVSLMITACFCMVVYVRLLRFFVPAKMSRRGSQR
jgi:hypothetical protein